MKITKIGTFDADGAPVGWEFSGDVKDWGFNSKGITGSLSVSGIPYSVLREAAQTGIIPDEYKPVSPSMQTALDSYNEGTTPHLTVTNVKTQTVHDYFTLSLVADKSSGPIGQTKCGVELHGEEFWEVGVSTITCKKCLKAR
jgi:hypothetical protein